MKNLMKQRITAVLFSLLPLGIYFSLLVLLTLICAVAGIDYDKIFNFINALSLTVSCVIMCVILKRRTGKRFVDALSVREFDIGIPLLFLVFTWCAGETLDAAVAGICSEFMTVAPNAESDTLPIALDRVVSAILIAPIFEEIMFRYLGTEFAEGYFPLPLVCVANAVCFTAMHGYNIQGFTNVMIYGLCSVYVYLKTKRLLYLIPVHMFHNALCLIDYGDTIFLGSPIYKEKNGFVLASPQWVLLNFVLAAACVIIYLREGKVRMCK